jgi:hypothetical protein
MLATMTTTASSTASRRAPARRARRQLLPNQHGAWAFLVLPFLLGACATGWSLLLAPLLVAWIAAYPFSWAVAALVSMPRPERYRLAAGVWSAVAAVCGGVVLVQRPWLVWALAAYAVGFAVNLRFARARAERSLANDLVLVVECTLLVPIVAGVVSGAVGWSLPWAAMTEPAVLVWAAACLLTLVGSTLHVKSLIRERRDPRFGRASKALAVVSVPLVVAVAVAGGVAWWAVALPFALLAGRALWLDDPGSRPGRIGMIELAGFLAVVAGAIAAATVG